MNQSIARLIDACGASLPPGCYSVDRDLLQSYERDGLGKHVGRAGILFRPADTAMAARIVELCARHRVKVVPQGGHTGFCGGATPDDSGSNAVVSLARMKSVRHLDLVGGSIAVDAGITLQAVQEFARKEGLLFPLSHGGEGSSQIGGNIATNAGGNAVLRYGTMRGLVLGLEVVLPDGRVLDLMRHLRKDTAGYDLKQIFIGAEGTLGLITGAVLKLVSQPTHRETALLALPSAEAAPAMLARVRTRLGEVVTACELMPRLGLLLHHHHQPAAPRPVRLDAEWYLLLEVATASRHFDLAGALEESLADEMAMGAALKVVIAQSEQHRQAFWSLREGLALAQVADRSAIKNDTSVPTDVIPRFLEIAGAKVSAVVPGVQPVPFGHVGDGNIHYNLVRPEGWREADFISFWPALIQAVEDAAIAVGGSIAAEHGIGLAKRERLARVRPLEVEIMALIKHALDPHDLMNPGKVVDARPLSRRIK